MCAGQVPYFTAGLLARGRGNGVPGAIPPFPACASGRRLRASGLVHRHTVAGSATVGAQSAALPCSLFIARCDAGKP
jgi:hypothetical protein